MLCPCVAYVVGRLEQDEPGIRLRAMTHVILCIATMLTYHAPWLHVRLAGDPLVRVPGSAGLRSTATSVLGIYVLVVSCVRAVCFHRRVRERGDEAAGLALHASRLETQLLEAHSATWQRTHPRW